MIDNNKVIGAVDIGGINITEKKQKSPWPLSG